jgi:hypothetical protein
MPSIVEYGKLRSHLAFYGDEIEQRTDHPADVIIIPCIIAMHSDE